MITLIDEHINRSCFAKKYSLIEIKVDRGLIDDTPSRLAQSDPKFTFSVENNILCLITNLFNTTKKDKQLHNSASNEYRESLIVEEKNLPMPIILSLDGLVQNDEI